MLEFFLPAPEKQGPQTSAVPKAPEVPRARSSTPAKQKDTE